MQNVLWQYDILSVSSNTRNRKLTYWYKGRLSLHTSTLISWYKYLQMQNVLWQYDILSVSSNTRNRKLTYWYKGRLSLHTSTLFTAYN